MKVLKAVLKILLAVVIVLIVLVAAVLIWLTIVEYRPEATENVAVQS